MNNLYFNQILAEPYTSNAQKIRVMSEDWIRNSTFCPNCGNHNIEPYQNNNPAADFYCTSCSEDFELKSKNGNLGTKIVDGAYRTMIGKIKLATNPNFLLMTYCKQSFSIQNLLVIPKHFFTQEIIEERNPLSTNAKRAGWIGCNLLLNNIPSNGKIYLIQNQVVRNKTSVRKDWERMLFLRNESNQSKGWILDIIKCIEKLNKPTFSLNDIYFFESYLAKAHPNNFHIKPKIRQQLQLLRDKGLLEFKGNGQYVVVR